MKLKEQLFFITFIACLSHTSQAQISGNVFRDYNNNGTRESQASYSEPGVKGIFVNAYNFQNQIIASYQTNEDGNYSLPQNGSVYNGTIGSNTGSVSLGQVVRLEFEIPESVAQVCGLEKGIDYTGYSGAVYGSSVQFVTGGVTDINFAINNPKEFRQAALPNVFIPCYVNGDPLAGGNSGAAEWFVSFPYTNTGTQMPTDKLNGQVLGATYGVAYSRQAKRVFTSAILKRHVGLGQMGSGGIYAINVNANATFGSIIQFYDLDANDIPTRYNNARVFLNYGEGSSFSISNKGQLNQETITYLGELDPVSGLPEGLGVIGNNLERGLSPDKGEESYDPAAYGQVGKVGLGDMTISDDGRYLFVTNLYSRKIVRLEFNNPYNPTSVVSTAEFSLPDINCNNGLLRPFGLKYHRGKLLVGAVCTGEFGGQNEVNGETDLYAYVFEMNEPGEGSPFWSGNPLVDFALNYQKGPSYTLSCPNASKWKPWTNTFRTICSSVNFRLVYEQPILSGISFDAEGAMILGFMDRMGHMAGGGNLTMAPLGDPEDEQNLYFVSTGGDLLKVFIDENQPCGYRLEQASDRTPVQNNNQGPDGGEFFYQDNFSNHHETTQGAIIIVPGTGEITSTVMDPFAINSGGLRWFSDETGQTLRNFQLYAGVGNVGLLGKANGLGAMDFLGEEPNLEIGNRVWLDSDQDGIQDANESGIDGLNVQLYRNGILVGETLTDNSGQYYFNKENVVLNGANGLEPITNYEIRVSMSQSTLNDLELTLQFADSPGNSEVRDSDAFESDGDAVITYTTGQYGANDHTLDIGFRPQSPPECVLSIDAINILPCDPSTNTFNIIVTVTYANPISNMIFINGESFTLNSAIGGTQNFTLEGLIANAQQDITVTASIGDGDCSDTSFFNAPEPCGEECSIFIQSVVPGECDPITNTYDVSIIVLWDNAPNNVIDINGEIFFISDISGSESFLLEGLPADGSQGLSVTAFFPGSDCSITLMDAWDAPENCESVCSVSIDDVAVSECDPESNFYSVAVTVTYTEAPGPELEINGIPFILAGTSGTETFTLENLIANGQTGFELSVVFPDTDCGDFLEDAWDAPESCEPVCSVSIDDVTVSECDPDSNFYSVAVTVTYTEAPGPELEINGIPFILAGTSGTETFTLENLIANGQTGFELSVVFQDADCGDFLEDAWDAPENCEPVCSVSIDNVSVSECDPESNFYSVVVTVTYTEAPGPELEINGIPFILAGTSGTETFTLENLIANGQTGIELSVVFPDTDCEDFLEDAWDAPENCEPVCLIQILSVIPSVCDPLTQTYMLFVEVSYNNLPGNSLIINGQHFSTLSNQGIETFILEDLLADGQQGLSLSVIVVDDPDCYDFLQNAWNAPETCEPQCPQDYSITEFDITFDVLSAYSIPICIEEECIEIPVYIDLPCEEFFIPDALNADFGGLSFTVKEVGNDFAIFEVCLIAGAYDWVITYTNPDGTVVSIHQEVTVDNLGNELASVFIWGAQNFTLPYCEDLTSTMIVQITDDCYSEVDPAKANFTLCGEPIFADSFDPLKGEFTFSFAVTADLHLCEFIAEYEDFLERMIIDVRTLAVNYTEDEVPPVIIYPSNDISVSIAECEEEEVEVCFYVTASDNCDGDIIPVVIVNGVILQPNAGENTYCITASGQGNYYVFIEASDSNGNVSQEDFNIVITEDSEIPDNLACIGFLNISLNAECEAILTPDMLLTGTYGCLPPGGFDISVFNNEVSFENIIDTCGSFYYMISLAEGIESDFQTCWGNVLVEDKLSPDIICTDGAVSCDELEILAEATTLEDLEALNIELPDIADNCGIADLVFVVGPVSSMEICEDRLVVITYTATDICGNTATCASVITILQDQLADICEGLENYDGIDNAAFECTGNWQRDANGNPHPSVTGRPLLQNCNIQCVYEDINVPICGPGSTARKILRRWTCVDWCLPNNQFRECSQVLKIKDEIGPFMSVQPLHTQVQGSYGCDYRVRFTRPLVTGVCSDVVRISVSVTDSNSGQVFSGDFFNTSSNIDLQVVPRNVGPAPIPNPWTISVGVHQAIYTAEDACGNITEIIQQIELIDRNAPVAICEAFRVASLDPNCRVRIFAESFSDGSYDVCGIDRMTVRRMNPSACYTPQSATLVEASFVDFCCADFGTPDDQRTVVLRVYDLAGNTNECMALVDVQDKILPVISCPPNITVDCRFHFGESDEELANAFGRIILPTAAQPDPSVNPDRRPRPELYDGFPYASSNRSSYINIAGAFLDGWVNDNCSNSFSQCFLEVTVTNVVSLECRQGAPNTQGEPFGVRRTFTVRDAAGNTATCTQFISVVNLFPFMGGAEIFPGFYNGGELDRGYYRVFRQPTGTTGQVSNALSLLNGWPADPNAVPTGPYEGGEGVNPNPSGPQGIDHKVRYRIRPINTVYPARWDIVWPADLLVNECRGGLHPDSLALDGLYRVGSQPYLQREDFCAQVGISYDEWEFDFDAGCKKLVRTWKVVDWCQESTLLNPWMWTQVIKVVDNEAPEITVGPYDPCTLDICNSDQSFPKTLEAFATDDCLNDGDQIRWDVEIWVNGNPDVVVTANGLTVSRTADGRTGIIRVTGFFPLTAPGMAHKAKFIAEDGCGNKTTELFDFEVRECKKPTPVCYDGIATDLMPVDVPMVQIQASTFNAGSYDNCTPKEELRFRLGRDVSTGQTTPPSSTSLIFTCEDLGIVPVAMWVGDNYNNWDYCVTYLIVQNNMGAICEEDTSGLVVGGTISNMYNEGLADVSLESTIHEHIYTTTNISGNYQIALKENTALLMQPYLESDIREDLSTLDVLMIHRHIAGIELLDNPFRYIAADVDRSGSITPLDMIELRRIILGKQSRFSNNKVWRFIGNSEDFEEPNDALRIPLKEVTHLNRITASIFDEDYIGVKTGDVSLLPKDSLDDIDPRSPKFSLSAANAHFKAGEIVQVDIKVPAIHQFMGMQFTLNYNHFVLDYTDFKAANISVSNENLGINVLHNGLITFSWHQLEPMNYEGNEHIFSLQFFAQQDGYIRDVIQLTDDIARSLIISGMKEWPLQLSFRDAEPSVISYELFQNTPNPFISETNIGFNLPESMPAALSVYDTHGKIIYQVDGNFAKGYNQVIIRKDQLPVRSVLYYQLHAHDFSASRKMILMD
jgi:hypothetical protein